MNTIGPDFIAIAVSALTGPYTALNAVTSVAEGEPLDAFFERKDLSSQLAFLSLEEAEKGFAICRTHIE